MGDEYGMESVAILIFWSLIITLFLWLVYILISNKTHTKNNMDTKNNEHAVINQKDYDNK